jgi:hypothetical protein
MTPHPSRSRWIAPVLISLMLLSACSSAKKRAIELLEKENYEEAATQFEELVKKSPDDTDLPGLLSKARNGVLDRRLISVRMDRMAGNSEGALEKLLGTFEQQRAWKVSLNPKLAFTAEEETVLAWPGFERSIANAIQTGKPIKSEWRLKRYQSIFTGDQGRARKIQILQAGSKEAGARLCENQAKLIGPQIPWQSDFTARICAYFGADAKAPRLNTEARALKTRSQFRTMDITGTLEGLSAGNHIPIKTSLQQGFEQSPYFSTEAGGTLSYPLSGSFVNDLKQMPVRLSHAYTRTEEYYDLEEKKETKLVDGKLKEVTKREKVKKTREVPDTYYFDGIRIDQRVELVLTSGPALGGAPLPFSFQRVGLVQEDSHDVELKSIGLKARPIRPLDSAEFVKAQQEGLRADLNQALVDQWQKTFCSPSAVLPGEAVAGFSNLNPDMITGERVQTCVHGVRAGSVAPVFAEDWYRNQLDITLQQARDVLQIR